VNVLVLVFLVSSAYPAIETTLADILQNKDHYDGKEVWVSGTVSKIKTRTSKGGSEYTTFSLIDSSGESIRVFTWGHSKIKEGQKVRVTGTYRKVKKVRRYTFCNEIEAAEIL
jgi:DNA polymerase III alpha subunit